MKNLKFEVQGLLVVNCKTRESKIVTRDFFLSLLFSAFCPLSKNLGSSLPLFRAQVTLR